jgi:hypothetical protein
MLLLVFLMMLLGLFALFLGGGLVAQGYLYQNPADRMPIRALAAALLVAGFVTLWVWIDQKSPGRYDTLFNFSGYSAQDFDEFEAVRWKAAGGKLRLDPGGNYVEATARFKRTAGGRGATFVEEGTGQKFEMSGSFGTGGQYMTGAIRIKTKDDPEPVRYNLVLREGRPRDEPWPTDERRFQEENGGRYVTVDNKGQFSSINVPHTGTVAVSLLLNFALVVVWLAAFWPILRFSLAHALIFAGALALLTMLAVMPVLFKQNRAPKTAAPEAAALVASELGAT